jgi:hypothetical protein
MALRLRALGELVRYDVLFRAGGFASIRRHMRPASTSRHSPEKDPAVVCRAVAFARSFYWKPVLCMQASVVTARLLRAKGIQADVVIGYRADPFLSHAWVEANGRVVNDSPVYKARLAVLDRF